MQAAQSARAMQLCRENKAVKEKAHAYKVRAGSMGGKSKAATAKAKQQSSPGRDEPGPYISLIFGLVIRPRLMLLCCKLIIPLVLCP